MCIYISSLLTYVYIHILHTHKQDSPGSRACQSCVRPTRRPRTPPSYPRARYRRATQSRAMQLSDRAPADWPKWGPGRRPSDLAGSAAPLCLNTATYEEGIECIPVPVQCDAYPAPPHGSVWGPGGEYKIASPAGLEGWPRQESLFVTCDAAYRLSEHGRQTVRCLRSGQWEVGKTCVPIMCQVCLCL